MDNKIAMKNVQSNFEINNSKSKSILNLKLKPNVPIPGKFHANNMRQKPIVNLHGYYESFAKHNSLTYVNLIFDDLKYYDKSFKIF